MIYVKLSFIHLNDGSPEEKKRGFCNDLLSPVEGSIGKRTSGIGDEVLQYYVESYIWQSETPLIVLLAALLKQVQRGKFLNLLVNCGGDFPRQAKKPMRVARKFVHHDREYGKCYKKLSITGKINL
ncbi:hypothetical protein CEXT_186971 [Caerostris extrusa]|uniref:Uncharacterized protein n=1 Tax=Caerostris extrusa TaxID=172846 RepID=A0AAV4VW85_CAEEX|nr:hypothetical protein CEXT_186971 [Caerostris extrusa]